MRKYVLGLAALLLIGCAQQAPVEVAKEETTAASDELKLSPEAARAGGIETGIVSLQTIQAVIEVPGSVTIPGNARAVVTPPVAGKIVRLFTEVGDSVRAGQPLAEIQSGDLAQASSSISSAETEALEAEATVQRQASAVALARTRLRAAQASLTRQKQLASAGAFSQPTLTAARNEVSEAETEDASARSQLAGAQSRLDRAERLGKEGLVSKADLDQARLDARQAQIRVERAAQRVALAEQTLQRETKIGGQGLLNAKEIQAAEAEVRAVRFEVDQAQINLQSARSAQVGAQRAVANARATASALRGGGGGNGSVVTLTAPISGIVTERQATLGQAVERSSDLFDIEEGSVVWVIANVPEAAISRVHRGVVVSVTTDAFPGKSFAGVVEVVGTRLDPKTRTLPVQCRVPNPARLLRADLFARVRIASGKGVRALAVPVSSLVGEPQDQGVFVSETGKFELRKVKVGRTDGKFVEILEGLKSGEEIAITGVFTLQSELRKGELKEEE